MRIDDQSSSFVGSLLGLALGDALGAPLEGRLLERGLWRLIGKTRDGRSRWTDDTQMALDLAESLIAHGAIDQDDIAQRFARSYHWSRGYGPGAARILRRIREGADWRTANTRVFREGSFGNGGAMRAPVVGLFCANNLDCLTTHTRASAVITHAHPLAQDAAVLVALTTALALRGHTRTEILEALQEQTELRPLRDRLATAKSWIVGRSASPQDVVTRLGNGIAAAESCVTAIYVALRFIEDSFVNMLDFVAACRGDVDTIGAMAGAIWGARNGDSRLPPDHLSRLEEVEHIREVALNLHRVTVEHGSASFASLAADRLRSAPLAP